MSVRLAFRTLGKAPFVTIVAIASLALGIGANTAIYSIFDQVLRRPLPVTEPERLVNLGAPPPKPGSTSCNQAGDCDQVFSYPMYRDLEKAQTVFTELAAHFLFGANLAARGRTVSAEGLLVSGTYFTALRLRPALGRLLTPADDGAPGEPRMAVVSYAYWRDRLGSDPQVLSLPLTVNGLSMAIVGVAPAGFEGTTLGARPDVFVPVTLRDVMIPGARTSTFENRRNYWLYLFGRLKPGVTPEQARSALNVPYRALLNDVETPLQLGMSDQTLARFKERAVTVSAGARGQTSLADDAGAGLRLLLGVTVFVLLIACANIANLLLARSAARSSEMAIRLSIGASRRHLIAQLMTESLLLAAIGGVAGLGIAVWTLDLMAAALPAETARTLSFRLDCSVLPVAAAVTFATGIVFGLFPALHCTRPDLVTTLKGQAGQPGGSRAARRFRASLATSQIALSMTLLVAAGLFTRSLWNVGRVALGLNPERIVMFRVVPGASAYPPERSRRFFNALTDRLSALPGVQSVTRSVIPLLSNSNNNSSFNIETFEAGPDTDTSARTNRVGIGYFATLGIPILGGRDFTAADSFTAPKVAIVNEAFLRKFKLGPDAIGRKIGPRDGRSPLDTTIVGIARDAKYSEVKQEMLATVFTPADQFDLGGMTYYIKTDMDPSAVFKEIQGAAASLDPDLPVSRLTTLPQQIRDNVFLDRVVGTLATAFAVLATLLAAIGLYGVLSYTVSLRTRELGLRMALGAAPSRVRGLVMAQVGRMLAVGGVVGLTAAVWLASLAASLLFEMKGTDPAVLVFAAATLSIVALAAGFAPAHRAASIDPMKALRYE